MTDFVIADLHLGDEGLCGKPPGRGRPFGSAAEMEGFIVRCWNDTIADGDTVYILGDVGRRVHLERLRTLSGNKHLIAGNRDDLSAIVRAAIFSTVNVARCLPGLLLTHIPVHASQLRAGTINVHGHLHAKAISDPRYVCVSVERTNYRPIRVDELWRLAATTATVAP